MGPQAAIDVAAIVTTVIDAVVAGFETGIDLPVTAMGSETAIRLTAIVRAVVDAVITGLAIVQRAVAAQPDAGFGHCGTVPTCL